MMLPWSQLFVLQANVTHISIFCSSLENTQHSQNNYNFEVDLLYIHVWVKEKCVCKQCPNPQASCATE